MCTARATQIIALLYAHSACQNRRLPCPPLEPLGSALGLPPPRLPARLPLPAPQAQGDVAHVRLLLRLGKSAQSRTARSMWTRSTVLFAADCSHSSKQSNPLGSCGGGGCGALMSIRRPCFPRPRLVHGCHEQYLELAVHDEHGCRDIAAAAARLIERHEVRRPW